MKRSFVRALRSIQHSIKQLVLLGAVLLIEIAPSPLLAEMNSKAGRGIWYDPTGIGHDGISENDLEVAIKDEIRKFNRLHIDRVHIVLNAQFDQIARCECERSKNEGVAISKKCGGHGQAAIMAGREKRKNTNICTANAHFFAFDNWTYKTGNETDKKREEILGIFVDALGSAGKQVILTVWPTPNPNFINVDGRSNKSNFSTLINFVKRHDKNIWGIEFEDEDNWVNQYTGSFGNINVAANRLFDALSALPSHVKIGATVSPKGSITDNNIGAKAAETFADDLLLQRANFISFQAYQPAYQNNDPSCSGAFKNLSGPVEPGEFQRRSITAIEGANLSAKPIIMGVSAFQLFVGMRDGVCIDSNTCGNNKVCKDDINKIAIINIFKGTRAAICEGNFPRSMGISYWSVANLKADLDNRGLDYSYDVLAHCLFENISKTCGEGGEFSIDRIKEVCPGLKADRSKGLNADQTRAKTKKQSLAERR
jgi:hypothetical protein